MRTAQPPVHRGRPGAADAPGDTSGDPEPELHDIRLSERVDHGLLDSPIRYLAECDCGWVGVWHATAVGAKAEGNQHQALARRGWSGPPDRSDRAFPNQPEAA